MTAATVDGIRVADVSGRDGRHRPIGGGLVVHAVPSEGIDVTLEVRGEGPLPLRVVGYRGGLPQVPELTPRAGRVDLVGDLVQPHHDRQELPCVAHPVTVLMRPVR